MELPQMSASVFLSKQQMLLKNYHEILLFLNNGLKQPASFLPHYFPF